MKLPFWLTWCDLIASVSFVGMWLVLGVADVLRADWLTAAVHGLTGGVLTAMYVRSAWERHRLYQHTLKMLEARERLDRTFQSLMSIMSMMAAAGADPERLRRAQEN